ncbi:Os10g0482000 [Oryza sativa Japonica Group]|uniref:Os10g0482000 protein n=1 Tax=Oryza sativa subsp. japonica TaxID=39947 RepID=A0A0P0XW33_ORYSJ|nr:hypothetical protein EE612_051935 [Oryza sativa]BAT11348.1 Os10g0482000 [Oryza sativa Japonica Group]
MEGWQLVHGTEERSGRARAWRWRRNGEEPSCCCLWWGSYRFAGCLCMGGNVRVGGEQL